jgi:hypothetical protein
MHIRLVNGVPEAYSVGQLRRDNPQVSFPVEMPDARLAEWDVYPLTATPKPSVDHTQNVTEVTPQQINGVWTQVWVVSDATPEQIAARTAAQASDMRQDRNARLAACDWTQLADAPVDSAAWANYRQALRDVTAHAGFPWSVVWPDAP